MPDLTPAQDWAIRAIVARGRPITAQRVGKIMLDRPELDTTGKTYSAYTLGRMGGGMLANLKKNGMVRVRKVRKKTVGSPTHEARRRFGVSNNTATPAFFDTIFAPDV